MAADQPTMVPEPLRTQVLAEWAPIAPLRSPWRRAAWLAPVAAVMTGIAATYWGPQPDWAAPGSVDFSLARASKSAPASSSALMALASSSVVTRM